MREIIKCKCYLHRYEKKKKKKKRKERKGSGGIKELGEEKQKEIRKI